MTKKSLKSEKQSAKNTIERRKLAQKGKIWQHLNFMYSEILVKASPHSFSNLRPTIAETACLRNVKYC